jgi:uncharacterized protein YdeI (YjbR/CyaY-like superfamily)
MEIKETETFCPSSQQDWRRWLKVNHKVKQSVWVLYYKKKCNRATVTYNGAVDEALCFGWIDSTRKSVDSDTFIQFFCRRKPNSVWSKINKAKVQRLIADGLMTTAGMESIHLAKHNGSWTILDDVEELVIPADLAAGLRKRPGSEDYFLSLSKSVRKSILQWLVLAKRSETRIRRITEIAQLAADKKKPKQFT